MSKICVYCVVSGRVQGVYYRSSTEKVAQKIGITGWVRNMPNGDVEVTACGDEEQIQELVGWMRQGPSLAKVDSLVQESIELEEFPNFEVRY